MKQTVTSLAILSVTVMAVFVSCGRAELPPEPATNCPSFANIPAHYEKPKNPAINATLENCFAELSKAQTDLRSLYGEGKVKRFFGIQGMWQAYVEVPHGDFSFVFKSETGPLVEFQQYGETDGHRHPSYDIGFDSNGTVKSFRPNIGSAVLEFYPNGSIKQFFAGIGPQVSCDVLWNSTSKLQSEQTYTHVPELPHEEKNLPELEEALRHGDNKLKWAAVESMSMIGTASVPRVVGVLQDGDARSREMAATILQRLGKASASTVPILARRLGEDNSIDVQCAIARCLGAIGPDAESAIPALEQAASKDSPTLAAIARKSLELIRNGRGVTH